MQTYSISLRPFRAGFTLVEIMIVVAIIGLLAAVAVPGFRKSADTAQRTTCMRNLKEISGAKERWALENRTGPGVSMPEGAMSEYLDPQPECPASGEYHFNALGTAPTCTIPGHTLARTKTKEQ